MTTLTLNLPKTVKFDERELFLMLATKLYERGSLSLGQAAEIAGLSKRAITTFRFSTIRLINWKEIWKIQRIILFEEFRIKIAK